MTTSHPLDSRRVAIDRRAASQIEYLTKLYLLTLGDAPSGSQVIRRALSLLADHLSVQLVADRRTGGVTLPAPVLSTERASMADHARLADAAAPFKTMDERGRLLTWPEATGWRGLGASLAIPQVAEGSR